EDDEERAVYEDLLVQAVRLARLDVRRPRQANLRRAISSADYAVFHLLVDEACRAQIGAHHNQAPFRQVLGRAVAHRVLKEGCKSFGGGTLKGGSPRDYPWASPFLGRSGNWRRPSPISRRSGTSPTTT